MYKISRCEPGKTFAKKDGSGDGQMQKIVLWDDTGKDHKTTIFPVGEACVVDIAEATMKNYNEKFKEYRCPLKAVTAGPRAIVNTEDGPKISVE